MSISPKMANSTPDPDDDSALERASRAQAARPGRDSPADRRVSVPVQVRRRLPADCDEVERYLVEFPEIDRSRVMLMPQGTDADKLARTAEWLEPYCQAHDLHFCPRRQIEWFGLVRGT